MEREYGMTRNEERIEAAKQRYGVDTQYLIAKTQSFLVGAKWADETMIDKACEWLCMNMTSTDYFGINGNLYKPDFVDKFKKAMKGE